MYMTIKTTHLRGRAKHTRGRGLLVAVLSLLALAFTVPAFAQSTLKDVS